MRNRLRPMGRRGLLTAFGASALALPFLHRLGGKAQEGAPKRLLVVFSPNGTIPGEWRPDGGETDFRFRRILAPLEDFRDYVTVLGDIDMRTRRSGPGDGHQKGMGEMLTGVDLLPGDTGGGCNSCAPVSWAGGISIDQHIANHISTDVPFRSLELGAHTGGSNIWTRMAYRGASEPLPPEDNPFAAFDRVFGEFDVDATAAALRREEQRSVLDSVMADFDDLDSQMGREDRQRLAMHADIVRDLERRLEMSGGSGFGASCRVPDFGDEFNHRDQARYPEVLDLQADLVTAAFACDQTRVASIQWNRSVGNMSFPWIGVNDRHHDLSHKGDGEAEHQESLVKINTWYAERFADLMRKMQAIEEPGGTLLDNTLILWCNELGKGNNHTANDIPFVLGGRAGGAIRSGRWLRYDRPHNDLLLTIAHAFGVEDEQFGDPRYNEGLLPGLLA
ncbi:MAG: DUF1552 domain-containing protein [Myxococcota bacterium]